MWGAAAWALRAARLAHFSTTCRSRPTLVVGLGSQARKLSSPNRVWTPAGALRIDSRDVFEAAFLGVHAGHVGLEGLQQLGAPAGLGGDDGQDVNGLHERLLGAACSWQG